MSEEFTALLVVQDHDIAIAQLVHRREHLPARAARTAAIDEAKGLLPQHAALLQRRDGIAKEERRIDDEVQLQRAKADDVNTKLYSGTVTASKELQALQADLDSIRAHIGTLEDAELEQMQLREEVEAEIGPIETRLAQLQAAVQTAEQEIADGEREVDSLLGAERARRSEAADKIAPGLLSDYEKRRDQNRGQGAARLIGDTCQACRLSIPATEVDAIVHDTTGAAWYCDNCGAILVASPR